MKKLFAITVLAISCFQANADIYVMKSPILINEAGKYDAAIRIGAGASRGDIKVASKGNYNIILQKEGTPEPKINVEGPEIKLEKGIKLEQGRYKVQQRTGMGTSSEDILIATINGTRIILQKAS